MNNTNPNPIMKRLPPLSVTEAEIYIGPENILRHVMAVAFGKRQLFFSRSRSLSHMQRHWDPITKTTTWRRSEFVHYDYHPIDPRRLGEVVEANRPNQGEDALIELQIMASDCPAIRAIIMPIIRLFF